MIAKIPKADAYGGVLVNAKGEVLLREPTQCFGDYAWAFPNGKPHKGEKPDQAALRIVREETGYCARIITPIPLAFGGQEPNTLAEGQMMLPGIFTTAFYLMEPLGRQGKLEKEITTTRWINFEKASDLITRSTNKIGRERDLAVLRAAKEAFEKLPDADRPATCKEDWKTLPMPRLRRKIALNITYDADAMKRIRKGFLPVVMEDKWFAWFEEPILHLHRSWTGFCIYEVNFIPDRDGWRANFASVNRDAKQYTCADDDMERQEILGLIDRLLLHVC